MAAYAALVSLTNTVKQLQNHVHLSTFLDEKQVESLVEKLGSLQDLVERYSHEPSQVAPDLLREIARAAYAAEDLIESHVADRIILGSPPSLDLQRVIQEMDSKKDKAKEILHVQTDEDPPCSEKLDASSTRASRSWKKTTMVGFVDEKSKIMDSLTRDQEFSCPAISIVGMGGAGKTTLARSIYDDPCIVDRFDIRIWVVVSEKYNMRDILLQIPDCIKQQDQSEQRLEDHQLGEVLYKCLWERRYLVIMDDIWSTKVWNDLKRYFPNNSKTKMGRILVTTRQSHVAEAIGSNSSNIFKLNFLEKDESWNLFCENAFIKEACPLGLVDIGKSIVEKCKGLPLSIVVIGGLLASCATPEYWKSVAEKISSSTMDSEYDHCLNVLSLSYSHLPAHLKPCFLYMGIFPEDDETNVSQLIKLWVAEGFLKPNNSKSLEELAEGYLKDLVDRNLIIVHTRRWNGRIKTCGIHDLLHVVCLREAEKEFFCVRKRFGIPKITDDEDHASKYWRLQKAFDSLRSRSHVLKMPEKHILSRKDKLLRVLNNVQGRSHDIFGGVNLRYICYTCYNLNWLLELPSSISQPWNLQTLICDNINVLVRAPIEIWDMQQLRHVEFPYIHLPNPPASKEDGERIFVFENLQTLKKVVNFEWSEEAIKRIPSIKELKIAYMEKLMGAYDYHLSNICLFKSLESLHVDFRRCRETRRDLSLKLKFPDSLKKLTLEHSGLCWHELSVIACLPRLEVFKHKGVITGDTWSLDENEFRSLKSLDVENCNGLIYWNADSSHFPRLENLRFGFVPNLDEIPLDIGSMDTLKAISLLWCQATAAISAVKLLEEQERYGYEDLEVHVMLKNSEEERFFREKVTSEELESKNFHVVETHETAAAAVERFQAPFRRHLLKKRCEKVKTSTSEIDARRIVAAMIIQDAFRNKRTRKKLAAATIFQHGFRRYQTPKKFGSC